MGLLYPTWQVTLPSDVLLPLRYYGYYVTEAPLEQ